MDGSRVLEVLGPAGAVARRLDDYEERPQQLEFAAAVERALAERRHLLAEAGTGIGKSFAYLLPAVLHACAHRNAGPVVVSTRTIALQQQLEQKDLPFLQQILPDEWTSVTALGRNNYVCLRRLHLARSERGLLFTDPAREAQLDGVMQWSLSTQEGTRQDLPRPVDREVWDEVQAEHGNCLHRACPHYEPCPYQRSRRRLASAQILIVNHALYMADVALRLAGASYLPAHEVVIFDEAHHLERVATEHLGLRLTETTLGWHLRRLHARNADRSLLLRYGSARAGELWHQVREAGATFFGELDGRLARSSRETLPLGDEALDGKLLVAVLGELGGELERNCAAVEAVDRRMELQARARGLIGVQITLEALCRSAGAGTGASALNVRWIERTRRGAALRSAPLEVGAALRQAVFAPKNRCAILTSATLAPGADPEFRWMRERLGIDAADTLQLGSPFDYRNHVELVLEEALPDPTRDGAGFLHESKQRVLSHLLDNGGRALVLCTSWHAVTTLEAHVRTPLQAAGIRLLVQGEDTLSRLLEIKLNEPTSVLLGTDTLWEGIDVRGEALTLVIVTRFPFAPPDHPLARARMRAIEERGGNAFGDYSLPEAVLRFRQGFGRLVRSRTDRGKVVILDPRARTRPYGRAFLAALPEGMADEDTV